MNVETTLTIPEGLDLLLEGDEVEVSISSNLRDYRPRTVNVRREGLGASIHGTDTVSLVKLSIDGRPCVR